MGMSLIVKKVTQFAVGLIFLYGIYIILFGHLTPGGGFPGGVILACCFILIILAFGKDVATRKMRKPLAHLLDSGGALAFFSLAMLGYIGGSFFVNFLSKGTAFHLRSAGFIPLANIAIGIKILASVFLVFVALFLFGQWVDRPVSKAEEEEED